MTTDATPTDPTRIVVAGGFVWDSAERSWTKRDVHISGDRFADGLPDDGRAPDEVIDAQDRLVLPGLVNAHTHGHNNLLRGTGDCRYLEGHINAMSAVGQWTPRDLYLSTMVGIIEMLKSGTTTAYDLVRAPSDEHVAACVQAYRDAGMRAVIAPAISDVPFVETVPGLRDAVPPELLQSLRASAPLSKDAALAFAERAVRSWHEDADGRIQMAVGPLIADACTDGLIAEAGELARDLRVGTHMHLLESKTQALQGLVRGDGAPWVSQLYDLGYLNDRATFAHGVWLTPAEVATLADRGATVVHNPASNLKLGSGLAPVVEYLRAGLTVALATDGAASGDSLDMFGAMWLTALLSHSRTPDPADWLTAGDVVALATTGPARAVGHPGEIGAIVPGAKADLIVVDPRRGSLTPLNDATNQLVYGDVGRSVELVMVAGSAVVDNDTVLGIDESALMAEASDAAARLGVGAGLTGAHAELATHLDTWQRGLRAVPYPIDRYTSS